MICKTTKPVYHPHLLGYAKMLEVAPQKLFELLKGTIKIPGLRQRFHALHRLQKSPVPVKELIFSHEVPHKNCTTRRRQT